MSEGPEITRAGKSPTTNITLFPTVPQHPLAQPGTLRKEETRVYKHLFIADISGTRTWKMLYCNYIQGGLRGNRRLPLSCNATPIHTVA